MSRSPATVSVILPCHDQGQYLHGALDSIATASADKDRVEVVLVVHGANESNMNRLVCEIARLRRGDDHFKLMKLDAKGASAARNAGARAASGEYVVFMDADGLLSPGTIDVRLGELLERSADLVVTNYVFCNEEQSSFWPPQPATISRDELNFRSVSRCWNRGVAIPLEAGLFRRELMLRRPFDEDLEGCEAWVFWMRLLNATDKAEYIPAIGCVRRHHAKPSEAKDGMRMAIAWIDAAIKAARDIPQFGEIERNLARQYTETVHFDYFRQAFKSELPERFYGALFAELAPPGE